MFPVGEVLVRGSHAILQADKASDLGYEGGNVEVRVKQVRNDDATFFIGFPDGRAAWVNAEYLRPAKAGFPWIWQHAVNAVNAVKDIHAEHVSSRSLELFGNSIIASVFPTELI